MFTKSNNIYWLSMLDQNRLRDSNSKIKVKCWNVVAVFSCELYAGHHRRLGQGQLEVPAQLRGQRDQGGALLPESSTQQGLSSLWPRDQPLKGNMYFRSCVSSTGTRPVLSRTWTGRSATVSTAMWPTTTCSSTLTGARRSHRQKYTSVCSGEAQSLRVSFSLLSWHF